MKNYMPMMQGIARQKWLLVHFDLLSEEWAQNNHSQSLSRLAERGGLSADEMLAVMDRRDYKRMSEFDAMCGIMAVIQAQDH